METKEDHIKCFIDAYKNNNIASCNFELLFLILSYNTDIKLGLTYNHNLKHLLFQTNCIRNPMGFKYTIEDYDKYNQILYQTIKLCKAINNPNVDTTATFKKDLVIDDKIIDDITDIWVYTYCLYKMNSVNSQRMDTSKISQIPFVEQLLSIVLFYEDQTHILKQNYQNGLLKGIRSCRNG